MNYYEELKAFLDSLDEFFIEVEGKPDKMKGFVAQYNTNHYPKITMNEDGIIVLEPDANKWGLEYRLYVNVQPPVAGFLRNRAYRPNYTYRLNDNSIIKDLLNDGFKIGLN